MEAPPMVIFIHIAMLPCIIGNGDGLQITERRMNHTGMEIKVIVSRAHKQSVFPS